MKLNRIIIITGAGLLLAGCVTPPKSLVLDTVGPAPSAAKNTDEANGNLTVYTAYQASADFNSRDPYRREYTDYKILRPDGTIEKQVHNSSGSILQRPQQVALPSGNYRVVAQANSYGEVIVPVMIAGGQDTLVHLEGGFWWPNQHVFNETNAVRLPDGEVVGWKSMTAAK
jgi:hypothetical protein